ncbi:MAG: hypothetical protein Q9210_003926 [Variospora velana]
MSAKHHREHSSRMASLFSSGKYSDLTITCRDRAFHVHRLFLCSASRFFAAACDGVFKEAQDSQIDLSDDDPQTLERLLQYLYTTDYDDKDVNVEDTPVANASSTSSAQIDNATPQVTPDAPEPEKEDESAHHKASATMNNAAVYALAEKYNIASLKNLAKEKFEDHCACFRWGTESLVATLEFIYTSTPAADQGLRDVMARVCFQQINNSSGMVLDAPQLQELMMKEGALGLNVLVKAHEEARLLLAENRRISKEMARGMVKQRAEAARKQDDMTRTISNLKSQLESARNGAHHERDALHDLVWNSVLCTHCNKILDLKMERSYSNGRSIAYVIFKCLFCQRVQLSLSTKP